jgi:hypothetical protein
MAFHVHVAKLVAPGRPFDVTLISDHPVTITITVRVAGETDDRKFGLIMNGESWPVAPSQDVPVAGRAACQVTNWGTVPAGSALMVSGDTVGEHHDGAGVVLASASA